MSLIHFLINIQLFLASKVKHYLHHVQSKYLYIFYKLHKVLYYFSLCVKSEGTQLLACVLFCWLPLIIFSFFFFFINNNCQKDFNFNEESFLFIYLFFLVLVIGKIFLWLILHQIWESKNTLILNGSAAYFLDVLEFYLFSKVVYSL